MQILQLRLKRLIQWIKTKKQSIHTLITNHLPIYRTIKQFILSYIQNMNEIVDITQNIMKQMNTNVYKNNSKLFDLIDLIRVKELAGIDQWMDKLDILEAKYAVGGSNTVNKDNRKFPDIFKDIDDNVIYYTELRNKLLILIDKQKYIQQQLPYTATNTNTSNPKQNINTIKPNINQTFSTNIKNKQKYAINIQKQRRQDKQINNKKTDNYAEMYDKIYNKNKNYEMQRLKQNEKQKQIEKEKQYEYQYKYKANDNKNKTYSFTNYKTPQLSPFKLVNPKYSPRQQKNKTQIFRNNTQSTQAYKPIYKQPLPIKQPPLQKQKYIDYTAQIYNQMHKIPQTPKRYKYTADKYLQNNNPIQYNNYRQLKQKQYSTASTQKNKQVGYNKYWSNNNKPLIYKYDNDNQQDIKPIQTNKYVKKYQYLFDNKQDDQISKDYKPRAKNYQNQNYYTSKQMPLFKNKQPVYNKTSNANKKHEKFDTFTKYTDHKYKDHSLEMENYNDNLGKQLQMDMPVLFRDNDQDDLQKMLMSSLMSSKKWGKNDDEEYQNDKQEKRKYSSQNQSSEISIPDSLDQSNQAIRQTAKFKQVQYTDEDQNYNKYQKLPTHKSYISKYEPLTLQKQETTQSKDLNMSFGKN